MRGKDLDSWGWTWELECIITRIYCKNRKVFSPLTTSNDNVYISNNLLFCSRNFLSSSNSTCTTCDVYAKPSSLSLSCKRGYAAVTWASHAVMQIKWRSGKIMRLSRVSLEHIVQSSILKTILPVLIGYSFLMKVQSTIFLRTSWLLALMSLLNEWGEG